MNYVTAFLIGGIADATVGAVFYGNSLLGTILFLSLSPRWISLQHDWRAMEQYIDRLLFTDTDTDQCNEGPLNCS